MAQTASYVCGAYRDIVLDVFNLRSSWLNLRFVYNHNKVSVFSNEIINKFLPNHYSLHPHPQSDYDSIQSAHSLRLRLSHSECIHLLRIATTIVQWFRAESMHSLPHTFLVYTPENV